jgi:hypothetical protein
MPCKPTSTSSLTSRFVRALPAVLSLSIALLPLAALADPDDQPEQVEPTEPPPDGPPAPPSELPEVPQELLQPPAEGPDSQVEEQPTEQPQEAPAPDGQWVYTSQYGWVWMPYGQTYTVVPANGYPAMFLYGRRLGWRWVVAPWIYGWGPQPHWGNRGRAQFVWYAHPWFGRPSPRLEARYRSTTARAPAARAPAARNVQQRPVVRRR